MILFGSYTKGTARKIVILMSLLFQKIWVNDVTEMQWLWKKTHLVDLRIGPYPLNPRDLKFIENPIISEIVKWGVLV